MVSAAEAVLLRRAEGDLQHRDLYCFLCRYRHKKQYSIIVVMFGGSDSGVTEESLFDLRISVPTSASIPRVPLNPPLPNLQAAPALDYVFGENLLARRRARLIEPALSHVPGEVNEHPARRNRHQNEYAG